MAVGRRRIWIGAAVVLVITLAGRPHSGDTKAGSSGEASPSPTTSQAPSPSRPAAPPPKPTHEPNPNPKPKPKPAAEPTRTRAAAAAVAGVSVAAVPSPRLTPGATLPAGARAICVTGYSARVRDVSESEKDIVYARYHVRHAPYAHEVDHLISLELGGSNALSNLWPEPYVGRWGARTKDALEHRLHALVCDGSMSLRHAQHLEATNWVAAYRRLLGVPPRAASPAPAPHPRHHVSGPGSCEPGYSPCLPVTGDLNCSDLSASQTPVTVTGADPYGLDRDGDGTGCDS